MTGTLLGRVGSLISTLAAFVSSMKFVQRHDVCD